MSPAPALRVEAPAGWARAALDPPDLSQSPQIALLDWSAWRPQEGAARLVTACFSASTGTWTAEAEPLALDKISQVATSTALRIEDVGPLRLVGTDRSDHLVSQRLEGAREGACSARTFLGFQQDAVVGCFALCVDRTLDARCAAIVDGARITGKLGPPPHEGIGLRVTMSAVHHPREAATIGLAVVALGAVLAVATRRRPRVR